MTDAGHDGCKTGERWDMTAGQDENRKNAGQDGCRTGWMQDRMDAGLDGCRIGWLQDWTDAGQVSCESGGCWKDGGGTGRMRGRTRDDR